MRGITSVAKPSASMRWRVLTFIVSLLVSFTVSGGSSAAYAAPPQDAPNIRYVEQVNGANASGSLGAVSFANADYVLTFDGNTNDVVRWDAGDPLGTNGFEIVAGTASIQIFDGASHALLAQGTFLPSAGIFVSLDITNSGIGFGSRGALPSAAGFPGEPVYPSGLRDPTGTDALPSYDLKSPIDVTGSAISCVGFPTSSPPTCNAPYALPTDAGDLVLDQLSQTSASAEFTASLLPETTAAWTQASPALSPPARSGAAMAYDPATNQLLLFGGIGATGNELSDTWQWTGSTWTQLSPATSPPARAGASMAYDSATKQLLLFGGSYSSGGNVVVLSDTWLWTGATWTELSPSSSPPGRVAASMAYDSATDQLILFGGAGYFNGNGGDFNDTWQWTGSTWSQLFPTTVPGERHDASMAYDTATNQLLLFNGISGGCGASVIFGDTWQWTGSTWANFSGIALAGIAAVAAYNAATSQISVFGGINDACSANANALTWQWLHDPVTGGNSWINVSPSTSPPPRAGAMMAYDTAAGQLVLFGGANNGSVLADTWIEQQTVSVAFTSPTSSTAVVGQPVDYTVTLNPAPPGGTVAFTDNGTTIPGCATVTVDTAAGTATCPVSYGAPGSHTIAATYSGSGSFSTSASSPLVVVVNQAPTTTTYLGPATADYHDGFNATATLTGSGGAPVVGRTVTFSLGAGTGTETCSAVTDGTGTAQCLLGPVETPGTYQLTAAFAGDSDYLASSATSSLSITPEETTMTYTGPTVILGASGVTLTARMVEDGSSDSDGDSGSAAPNPAESVTLSIGTQTCTATTDASGDVACTIPSVSVPLGPETVGAAFTGDAFYAASSASTTATVFAFPSRGAFTLGDQTVAAATTSTTVTWWADSWSKLNSGGSALSAFKGFAATVTLPTTTPASPGTCTASWTTAPGNSPPPTTSIPSYMGVLVTSAANKNGSTIAGNTTHIVVVKTDPGYAPNPLNHGTGQIVATFC